MFGRSTRFDRTQGFERAIDSRHDLFCHVLLDQPAYEQAAAVQDRAADRRGREVLRPDLGQSVSSDRDGRGLHVADVLGRMVELRQADPVAEVQRTPRRLGIARTGRLGQRPELLS